MISSKWSSSRRSRQRSVNGYSIHLPRPTVEFSCRERAGKAFKKGPISRAKRSAGTSCSALRSPSLGLPAACADHTRMVPHLHDGRSVGITPSTESRPPPRASIGTTPIGNHAAQNGRPAPRAFVPRLHNGRTAQRACVPHRHNGRLHDGGAQPAFKEARFAASYRKRECRPHSPDAERFGH